MRLKTAIKRIVALGTGATLVGATILGAMAAADLKDYPKPFVASGAFNALLVVGANAKTEDVLGSIDIATDLQYATTVTKAVPGAAATVSVTGEGAKIETDSTKLKIGDPLTTPKTSLGENELPTLLSKGTYVNSGDDTSTEYEYTQKLEFGPSRNASVAWVRDRDYTDGDNPYLMLFGPKSTGSGTAKTWFMKYTLDFSKDAESSWYTGTTCGSANELCDIEDTRITILGTEYEITKAEWSTPIVTWEMMGGVSTNTMYEGETKTFTVNGKDYEVTVDIVSDTGTSSPSVMLTVNGDATKQLYKDQTAKVGGIEIGIKQIMGNEAGEEGAGKDLVQFYLGAQKVIMSDDSQAIALDTNVKIGGTAVDDLYVDWTISHVTDPVKVDKLVMTWVPSDDLFVTADNSVTFPGLGSFKVAYAGMTSGSSKGETITIEPDGEDNLKLTAPLETGTTSVDILYQDGTNYTLRGKASDELLVIAAGTVNEGDYIVLSDETERESHIVQLDRVSTTNITTLKDLGNGEKYEASCAAATCTINVGDTQAVFTSVIAGTSAVLGAASDDSGIIYTKEGLKINMVDVQTTQALQDNTVTIVIEEEDRNGVIGAGAEFEVVAGGSGTAGSEKATISSIADADGDAFDVKPLTSTSVWQYGDTKKWGYYTKFGTKVVWDKASDEYSVTISYPGEESHANVFVNSNAATVTTGGSSTYQEVQRIEVGAAKLDTEVASISAQNTIVVGGPCVNSLAATLMGNPTDCTKGFEMGKAMIKLFEQDGGKVAMLVAGHSAMDTRRACRVVANHEQYSAFKGTQLEVTGTSLTDIKVGVPAPVVVAPAATPAPTPAAP